MFPKYIQTALNLAHYEIIRDAEPYYGEIPELEGVWATGLTFAECKKNLIEAIGDWIKFSLERGYSIPNQGMC